MKKISHELLFVSVLIALSIFSRLIPHPWNFTAVTAAAMLAGYSLKRKYLGLVVALVSLVISDAVIGFHSLMAWVYIPFMLNVAAGFYVQSGSSSELQFFKGSALVKNLTLILVSSLTFFFVSNFGVWFEGQFYSKDLQGLVECYVAGLPFLKNKLAGDFFFFGILFGLTQMSLNFLQSSQKLKA